MKYTVTLAALAAVVAAVPAPVPKLPFNLGSELDNLVPKEQPAPSSCNLASAQLPAAPTALPAPAAGSTLGLVAIGKGTQNYTCADSSATTIPVAVGALATLYNASCIAASYPSLLEPLTQMAYDLPARDLAMLPVVGEHYFRDSKTPTFEVNTIGTQPMAKTDVSNPPSDPTVNVAWLYLTNKDTSTNIVNIYRVETNNGMQPANCSGVTPGLFTVPYAAQYWFYQS